MKLEDIKPGLVIQLPGYILYSEYGSFTHCTCELTNYVTVGQHDITFTVPDDFNSIAKAVESIDAQLTELSDDYHRKTSKLKEQKANLLQLTYGGNDILDAVPKREDDDDLPF